MPTAYSVQAFPPPAQDLVTALYEAIFDDLEFEPDVRPGMNWLTPVRTSSASSSCISTGISSACALDGSSHTARQAERGARDYTRWTRTSWCRNRPTTRCRTTLSRRPLARRPRLSRAAAGAPASCASTWASSRAGRSRQRSPLAIRVRRPRPATSTNTAADSGAPLSARHGRNQRALPPRARTRQRR
jgi:hypothetical protein